MIKRQVFGSNDKNAKTKNTGGLSQDLNIRFSLLEGCPILRQIYAWHCIVLSSHYNTVQKNNNKERSKTMRNLTKPCIILSEYWTSMRYFGKFQITVDS